MTNNNQHSGYVSIFRSIKNHWIFENDTHFKWWVIMLFEVNHKPNKLNRFGELVEIKRGQCSNSLRTWANLFNCTPKTVSKFFKLLEKDGMISIEKIGKSKQALTLINIENYNEYQGEGKQRKLQGLPQKVNKKRTRSKQEMPVNNVNDDKKEIFNKWLEYRSQIKKPIKVKSTLENLIKKINSEPLEKCQWVINESITNGYQGLFWDKYRKTTISNEYSINNNQKRAATYNRSEAISKIQAYTSQGS